MTISYKGSRYWHKKTCHTAWGWVVRTVWGPPPKEAAANRGLHEVVGGSTGNDNHAKGSSNDPRLLTNWRTTKSGHFTKRNVLVVEQRAKWPGCTEYLTHSPRRHCSSSTRYLIPRMRCQNPIWLAGFVNVSIFHHFMTQPRAVAEASCQPPLR